MFEKFLSKFNQDEITEKGQTSSFGLPVYAAGLNDFFVNFSGCSFNGGLYRTHSSQSIVYWNRVVGEAFPDFSKRICCFGYDWLGRQFALDSGRIESGEPLVLMLEPGTGEALEIPVNFVQFHEEELVNYANEALAQDFFIAWLSVGNPSPNHDQCISYKKPLFLGGADAIENLEPMDLNIYWELSAQLLEKVRKLETGTPINNIIID